MKKYALEFVKRGLMAASGGPVILAIVYQIERLPLASAIAIHAGALYLDYLMMYLLNSWIPRDLTGIGIFTFIFAVGYALVWGCIYCSIKAKTERINRKLRGEAK